MPLMRNAPLQAKLLRCGSCGHRQPFGPEIIARARRRTDRTQGKSRAARATATDPTLNDRLDDLVFAE